MKPYVFLLKLRMFVLNIDIMIALENNIYFSSEFKDMDLELVYKFIKNSYWGLTRTYEEQQIASKNTINFGFFKMVIKLHMHGL